MNARRNTWFGAALLGALTLSVVACGDDEENPSPSGTGTFTTSSGSRGSSGSGGGDGGGGLGGGGQGGSCEGPDGCFACPPDTTAEFLEACTDAQCAAFDNDARLPLLEDGELPPLP